MTVFLCASLSKHEKSVCIFSLQKHSQLIRVYGLLIQPAQMDLKKFRLLTFLTMLGW